MLSDAVGASIVRAMAHATFANTVGGGLWAAGQVLYLTREVGLSPTQVGLGLSVGGAAGLLSVVPLGGLADRFGPRNVRAAVQLLQALVMVCYLAVDSMTGFLVVVVAEASLIAVSLSVRASLIAALVPAGSRVRLHATLSVVASAGIAAGSAAAALALASGSSSAYTALVLANAATFLVSAALLLRLPGSRPPVSTSGPSRLAAIRDRRFVAVVLAAAVVSVHRLVLPVAMPLWIASRTDAPTWTVAALLAMNTALTAVLAVRLSHGMDRAVPAARRVAFAAATLAAAMIGFSLTDHLRGRDTVVVVMIAALAYSVGDVLHGNGAAGLVYDLADEARMGAYQSVNMLASGLAHAVGPALVTLTVVIRGPSGWLLLAGLFVAAGSSVPWLTRRAVSIPCGIEV